MNIFMICMLLTALLLHPSLFWASEIRQQPFSFIGQTVRYPVQDTFIVTGAIRRNELGCQHAVDKDQASCQLPVVPFKLGSVELASTESDRLLIGLQRCLVTPATGLIVTGHACVLGQESRNVALSRQRAESVAAELRSRGYTVTEVHGAGSRQPTTGSGRLELNRRVEVAVNEP